VREARQPADEDDLRERVRRLADALPPADHEDGDHRLNPEGAESWLAAVPREAAVLVPIVDRPAGLQVLLTTRAANLRQHAGQISFPGGGIDPDDAGPAEAALREAWEEIGLRSAEVDLLGALPRYRTTSGFRIHPVVGRVDPGFTPRLNDTEVADIFEVPLRFLMDPANHRRDSRFWRGHMRHFYVMPFAERHIWGVTAGILRGLFERLYPE
jgi:8-oxo-dGTP pyrophosphatase MutT (NUDIX family)